MSGTAICQLRECEVCGWVKSKHEDPRCRHKSDQELKLQRVPSYEGCRCPRPSPFVAGSQLSAARQASRSPSSGRSQSSNPRPSTPLPPLPIYRGPIPDNRATTPVNRQGTSQPDPSPRVSLAPSSIAATRPASPGPASHEPRPLPNQPYRQQAADTGVFGGGIAIQRPPQATQFNTSINVSNSQVNVYPHPQAPSLFSSMQGSGNVQRLSAPQMAPSAGSPALSPMRLNPPQLPAANPGPVYRMSTAPIPQNSPLPAKGNRGRYRGSDYDEVLNGQILWLYDHFQRRPRHTPLWRSVENVLKARSESAYKQHFAESIRDRADQIRNNPEIYKPPPGFLRPPQPPSQGPSLFNNKKPKSGGDDDDGSGGANVGGFKRVMV